jgi:hypothetical protein
MRRASMRKDLYITGNLPKMYFGTPNLSSILLILQGSITITILITGKRFFQEQIFQFLLVYGIDS